MLRHAGYIDMLERDYLLRLHDDRWPAPDLPLLVDAPEYPLSKGAWGTNKWILEPETDSPRYIQRSISRSLPESKVKVLKEVVLRFPSAPLFGSQRERDYQLRLDPINFHTLRLLRPLATAGPVHRIFLMFNGLNETDRLDFYYDLSGHLLEDPGAACILCPLPGHLMRYPMVGRYAEKPLNRFIADPSDLFRQYLRFMVEIQWLLSCLVPVNHYPVVPGAMLLAPDREAGKGRCDPDVLSQAIYDSWKSLHASSADLTAKPDKQPEPRGGDVSQKGIQQTVQALRDLVGWQSPGKTLPELPKGSLPAPLIHVVGYSLGGYLAQSVFFTWPFAVSSCTTLCSGGALHEIRPVKFAHEEEWKAVTSGLKYELESGMLEQRIRIDPGVQGDDRSICGIPLLAFSSFFRIFNEVFLQDPNGSYRSRVSEFAPRLFFLVGGSDPIVTTQSVIAASPREGINMIEIANLSHFVATDKGEWKDFWLPALSSLMISFAKRTEVLLAESVLESLWNYEGTGPASGQNWSEDEGAGSKARHRAPDPLNSEQFQDELMNAVECISDDRGFLLVLRNRIPTALLGPSLLDRRGTVPHFEDRRIREYWLGLKRRREKMYNHAKRLIIVLPGRLNEWFLKPGALLSAKGEPSARAMPKADALRAIWNYFVSTWEPTDALFRFDPQINSPKEKDGQNLEDIVKRDFRTPEGHPLLNDLPDVWIALSGDVVEGIVGRGGSVPRDLVVKAFNSLVKEIYLEKQQERREGGLRPRSQQVQGWLERGRLRIILVSNASSNPRFLGERIWSLDDGLDLLVHSALALPKATQCTEEKKFSSGWPGSLE